MRKIFLTACMYPEGDRSRISFMQRTKPRFLEYCNIHGFEYVEIGKNLAEPYPCGWSKLYWMKQNMPLLSDGDVITYMDADCCIMDGRFDAVFDADFSIVQESTGCLCMGGTLSIRVSDWSKRFIDEMCSEERQAKNKDLESWKFWHENDAVYHVLGLEWGKPLSTMGTRNTTPFTKNELKEHVKILLSAWGCTFQPDDIDLKKVNVKKIKSDPNRWYYTVSQYVKKDLHCPFDDIIVRHLSAGTLHLPWADRYYNLKMKV
jgi:hypothetical protein